MTIKNNKIEYKKYLLGINIFLVLIIIILIIFLIPRTKKENSINITRNLQGSFSLTNPILDCEIDNNSNVTIFSKDVNEKIEELKNQYNLENISFYFRDLNNGLWIGVNEKDIFSPASLLKVPVFMSLLYEAETTPSILDKKVKVSQSDFIQSVSPNIVSGNLLVLDKEYSLLEVAESMIEKSDNTAITILLKNIKEGGTDNVFKSIGIPLDMLNNDFEIRVKDYAGFFRVLFNATYLNREMSEKALDILSRTQYVDGIVAGVPKNITVAHKFGERNIGGIEGHTQLHDCGIVYYPSKPYIFCVMTRGKDFINQSKAIKELSNYIYDEVDKDDDASL